MGLNTDFTFHCPQPPVQPLSGQKVEIFAFIDRSTLQAAESFGAKGLGFRVYIEPQGT